LLGETRDELGGAHVWQAVEAKGAGRGAQAAWRAEVPGPVEQAPALYRALHSAIAAGLVASCHDLSEGGLATAAAEMCIGGRLGLALTLPEGDPWVQLFSESNGRLLVEVAPGRAAEFEARFAALPCTALGTVSGSGRFSVTTRTTGLIDLAVKDLVRAWTHPA